MRRILGIDPGNAIMGWGVIDYDDTQLIHVANGVFTTKKDTPEMQRIHYIFMSLEDLIKSFHPDVCSVEELYIGRNVSSVVNVAQARGSILLCLSMNDIPTFEYHPMTVKKSVTGNGKANKGCVQSCVSRYLGLTEIPKPDDAADALGIALCHVFRLRKGERSVYT